MHVDIKKIFLLTFWYGSLSPIQAMGFVFFTDKHVRLPQRAVHLMTLTIKNNTTLSFISALPREQLYCA